MAEFPRHLNTPPHNMTKQELFDNVKVLIEQIEMLEEDLRIAKEELRVTEAVRDKLYENLQRFGVVPETVGGYKFKSK